MRGMRGGLWALGLAGAAYLWRNRENLQRQYNKYRGSSTPRQLPDYETERDRLPADRTSDWTQSRERPVGGVDV